MIKMWLKYGETMYGNGEASLIMKTWDKFNNVSRRTKLGHGQMTNGW
jgi:hypothetical protein